MATSKAECALRDLDDLQWKIDGVISMLVAIHDGMYYSPNNAKGYCAAVFAVCDYLERLNEDMKRMIEWGRD